MAAILGGFALGLIPYYVLPFSYQFNGACLWFIGLFAIGMVSAVISFSPKYEAFRQRYAGYFGSVALAIYLSVCAVIYAVKPHGEFIRGYAGDGAWMFDAVIGLSAGALLVYCAHHATRSETKVPVLLRILQSKVPVALGAFSYSLYLCHEPILNWTTWIMPHFHLSEKSSSIVLWVVSMPLALCLSFLFHLAFERPFMSTAKRTTFPGNQVSLR